jgi:rod shape-determining protein MreD
MFVRKLFLILALGVVALLIPGTVLKSINPALVAPNFILILLVYLAFYEGRPSDAFLAFLLGLELDLGSLTLLGPWAGSYVIVFAVLVVFSQRIYIESRLVVFIVVFLAVVVGDFLYLGLLSLVYSARPMNGGALVTVLLEGVFSAFFGALLFPPLGRLLGRPEREGAPRWGF